MEKLVFSRPKCMFPNITTYCPGCGHGIVQRLIGEVIDEFDLSKKMIICNPIGCSGTVGQRFDADVIKGAHGKAPAVATAAKRLHPDKFVMTYQGDGDIAAIGAAEIMNAASRGEKITVIFVNNAIYGMTGGQMAPTTLLGQVTTTTPTGRKAPLAGYPMRLSEMLAVLDGVKYVERVAVSSVKNIMGAKKAIRKAFQVQLDNAGLSLVEVLSACPTNLHLSAPKSDEWIENTMMKQYPLGVIKEYVKED